ncbi:MULTISPECIES: DoxX family protein [unclassified Tenacibaculum]|uniref:DoxX family protein n=1 Tax=unclassified Tenacibaculum TaxID=2635139 RepID=UPI001F208AB7|nr:MULTISPECIES: DoxX family protein [unclassified Tenacibaculum]MCF2875207.1 DoxX family protein [Tenacibaculum sp. Cn5-1]MCF2935283.1 DoxX family protein [Tenacibaculum sp. Cn5-34]MCG7511275.1 DoxX family protein [Tenacibaculum sp. Cn5-46]
MNILEKIQNKEIGTLIQRLSIGLLILFHGIANTSANYSFIKSLLSGIGLPEFIAYLVFIGEIVAPILILIGFRARLASFILAFNMLIAILMAHASDIFALNKYGGWAIELQALFLFGAASIVFLGAGKHAISTSSKWD